MKYVINLDKIDKCIDCKLRHYNIIDEDVMCSIENKKVNDNQFYETKPNWCPLQELPSEVSDEKNL